jgi:hypothetical protein
MVSRRRQPTDCAFVRNDHGNAHRAGADHHRFPAQPNGLGGNGSRVPALVEVEPAVSRSTVL